MTLTIHSERIRQDFERFSEDEIARCDNIAYSCLSLTENQLNKTRTVFEKFDTIYYKEAGRDAAGLFVCRDGSVLFADPMVSKDIHLSALQSGIRTKFEKLWKRKESKA